METQRGRKTNADKLDGDRESVKKADKLDGDTVSVKNADKLDGNRESDY